MHDVAGVPMAWQWSASAQDFARRSEKRKEKKRKEKKRKEKKRKKEVSQKLVPGQDRAGTRGRDINPRRRCIILE